MTKGGVKDKFVWDASQQKSFEDFKFFLCSAPILIMSYLQQPFDIETDALGYAIGVVLTQHGKLVSYHSETLSDGVCIYPTYDKDMYSIVKECQHWKN
jgi:hypothetical protein